MEKYKTIFKHEIGELEEKKSKFIANSKPVQTREEAENFINEIRAIHKSATHNCFAFRVYENGVLIERQSDDGEPNGTAGLPILNYLQGEDLIYLCIVVTRYYGGTLLGTGGLVRAYGGCAKIGAINSGIIFKEKYELLKIQIPYTLFGKVEYEILNLGIKIINITYTENVSIDVAITLSGVDTFKNTIIQKTSGDALISLEKEFFGFNYEGELYGYE